MAPPIYFFPRLRAEQLAPGGRLARSVLDARGLGATLADVEAAGQCSIFDAITSGPGGSSGTFLAALPVSGDAPPRIGYFPEWQEWQAFSNDLWIGRDKEHPPTPEDLRRKTAMVPGYAVELAGQRWEVPVLRDPRGGTGLPSTFFVESDGRVTDRVRDTHRPLFDRFAAVVDLFGNPDGPYPLALPRAEALDLCLAALAVNYRIGRPEQNLLGLVGSETWDTILALAVDWPTYRDLYQEIERQKKTRRASSAASTATEPPRESAATSPGPEDGSWGIDLLGPN